MRSMHGEKNCVREDGVAPDFCSTKLYPEAVEKAAAEYNKVIRAEKHCIAQL